MTFHFLWACYSQSWHFIFLQAFYLRSWHFIFSKLVRGHEIPFFSKLVPRGHDISFSLISHNQAMSFLFTLSSHDLTILFAVLSMAMVLHYVCDHWQNSFLFSPAGLKFSQAWSSSFSSSMTHNWFPGSLALWMQCQFFNLFFFFKRGFTDVFRFHLDTNDKMHFEISVSICSFFP